MTVPLNILHIHIRSENEPIRYKHGYIKPVFPTGNYSSIDQKNHVKWHVSEDNAVSVFCYVFGMSAIYDFDTIFLMESPERFS